jgi:methionyl-tRNA synthetase
MGTRIYLTTTLPYVNAEPHLGFALELVQADALARFYRARGQEVFFNTGTDEHGQKIWEAAQRAGREIGEYVDDYAGRFQALGATLNLSCDAFVRTTDPAHERAAAELWRRSAAAGDIELRDFVGLYCVGCEAYKTERDLGADGRCLIHPHLELSKLAEKNYFFKFSKYQNQLRDYLSRPDVIVPEWRRQEALNFVNEGLADFSISRERSKLSWGVPVPGDETQVMYVWFDALVNYISTLGWPDDSEEKFQKFWQEGQIIQLAGKDQVRFQSLMWQAMLMSADVKLTDQVFYHGFITSGGQKMSKSLGNVLNPLDLIKEYGADAVRYFLLRHVHPFDDSDVTLERFRECYNGNLANGLGNLVSRVMKMATSYGIVLRDEDKPNFTELTSGGDKIYSSYADYLKNYRFDLAAERLWSRKDFSAIGWLDMSIQQNKPFEKIKTHPDEAKEEVYDLLVQLYEVAVALEPLMPNTSFEIRKLIIENKMPTAPLFARK